MKKNNYYWLMGCSWVLIFATVAQSQILEEGFFNFNTVSTERISGNSVTDVVFDGQNLWVGTGAGLCKTSDEGNTWINFDVSDGIGRGGISAIAATDSIVWVATAYDTLIPNVGRLSAGGGLSYSTDGGQDWTHITQPGVTNVQNITYDIAILDSTVWITSWGGGLKKSDDQGKTWIDVAPDSFFFDPYRHLNHRAFSVLVVGKTLWVGTAGGINRSTDGGKTWTNFRHQNQEQPISGNFVVALGHQNYQGRNLIWAATIEAEDPDEFRAVSISEDEGYSWRITLRGKFAHNFAFDDSVAYVVTDNGLFKSLDGGETWTDFPQIIDRETGQKMWTNEFYSVAVTPEHVLWVGSSDGLACSNDGGDTWKIFRTYQPITPKTAVKTYAYPNPFSPMRHNIYQNNGHVRFHYASPRTTQATVKIYDFGMNLVRTFTHPARNGQNDAVWDGKNNEGETVANGVYFFKIEISGQEPMWGKIIVMD